LLLERVGGDRRALARLIRLFLADSRRLETSIRQAVARGKAADLRAAAHALKGSVSNFAATGAVAAAARLQRIAEGSRLGEAKEASARLREELRLVRGALQALVSPGTSRRPPRYGPR
jgi:HPt (histidine-containing phosphotransfer) domain-containing protein